MPLRTEIDRLCLSRFTRVFVGILAIGCASTHFADPHAHVVDVHSRPWSASIPNVQLVLVDPPQSDRLRDVVTNHSATARAYIVGKAWIAVQLGIRYRLIFSIDKPYMRSKASPKSTGRSPTLSGSTIDCRDGITADSDCCRLRRSRFVSILDSLMSTQ
jgi:hypothetical protein